MSDQKSLRYKVAHAWLQQFGELFLAINEECSEDLLARSAEALAELLDPRLDGGGEEPIIKARQIDLEALADSVAAPLVSDVEGWLRSNVSYDSGVPARGIVWAHSDEAASADAPEAAEEFDGCWRLIERFPHLTQGIARLANRQDAAGTAWTNIQSRWTELGQMLGRRLYGDLTRELESIAQAAKAAAKEAQA